MQILFLFCYNFAKQTTFNDEIIDICLVDKGNVTVEGDHINCYWKDTQKIHDRPLYDDVYLECSTPNCLSKNKFIMNVKPDKEVFIYMKDIHMDNEKYDAGVITVKSGIGHIIFSGKCRFDANYRLHQAGIQCETENASIIIQENDHYDGDSVLEVYGYSYTPRDDDKDRENQTTTGAAAIGTGKGSSGCNLIHILSGHIVAQNSHAGAAIGTSSGNADKGYIRSLIIDGGDITAKMVSTAPSPDELGSYPKPLAAAIGTGRGEGQNSAFIERLEINNARVYAFGGYTGASIGAGYGYQTNSSWIGDLVIRNSVVEAPVGSYYNGQYAAAIGAGFGNQKKSSYVTNLLIENSQIKAYPFIPKWVHHDPIYSYAAIIGGGCGKKETSGYIKTLTIRGNSNLDLTAYGEIGALKYAGGAALGGGRGGETGDVEAHKPPNPPNSGYVDSLVIKGGTFNLTGGNLAPALGAGVSQLRPDPSTQVLSERHGSVTQLIIEQSEVPVVINATAIGRSAITEEKYNDKLVHWKLQDGYKFECEGEKKEKCNLVKDGPITQTFTNHFHLFNPYKNPIFVMVIAAGFYTSFFYA